MKDFIKALQNEMVCTYHQISGCDHNCRKCHYGLEDSEIMAAYNAAIKALQAELKSKEQG